MNIGIYIYDEAEVLDFSGPFEVFSTASRISGEAPKPFTVFMISQSGTTVQARGGYSVNPSYSVKNHPAMDVLIVVGGDHTKEVTKAPVIQWIAETAKHTDLVASVCTGAFFLAEAGLLGSLTVTTHWEDIPDLRKNYPQLTVLENQRWVDQGAIVTSGGITAGIDMSLHLVSRLHSPELAERTARQMEFDWTKNS